jgi:hypothetical protein
MMDLLRQKWSLIGKEHPPLLNAPRDSAAVKPTLRAPVASASPGSLPRPDFSRRLDVQARTIRAFFLSPRGVIS